MDFYSRFSQYYDYIFPPQKAQGEFLKKLIKEGHVLDIACGTGNYTMELANRVTGKVVGIDLDPDMIKKATAKSQGLENVKFLELDMLAIDQLNESFNMVYCIGNSLPHLVEPDKIKQALGKMYNTLESDGNLVLQTVNYDRKPQKLPTIVNEEQGITFKRDYLYNENTVDFCTVLEGNDFKVEGKVSLYPITSTELASWLSEVGFNDIRLFGNFKEDEFKPSESTSMVVVATK